MTDHSLLTRRRRALFPGYELFYGEPLHLVRGEGPWLYAADGRRFLDAYNNVASVGHCHPRVVAAIAGQATQLNTHTRYLHDTVVRLAERLAGTLPEDLSSCMFVCTGSEANDLALRIARTVTGRSGVVVHEHAYFGNTSLLGALEATTPGAGWLGVAEAPDRERDRRSAPSVAACCRRLVADGHGVAAFLVDTIWDAQGVRVAPKDDLAESVAAVRAAGGLWIADEVQGGFWRTGDAWWSFRDGGVIPDIVTMGKAMGAGHPVAAVVTTPALAAAFSARADYFNTLGGNPVSAAAALAVLDVMSEPEFQANLRAAGDRLADGLRALARRHHSLVAVRGRGMFWSVELSSPTDAAAVVDQLCHEGVLAGLAGPRNDTIKLRPPLVLSSAEVDLLLSALDRAVVVAT